MRKPPRRTARHPAAPNHWKWLGAAVGLMFTGLIIGGFIWIVASGVGTGRWVMQFASPSPRPQAPLGAPTASPRPMSQSSSKATGTISGSVGFPAASVPSLKICAENITDSYLTYCTEHIANTPLNYQFEVPVAEYYVYASVLANQSGYSTDYRAYYDQSATCQVAQDCASLRGIYVKVPVRDGQTISDVNPNGWYTPPPGN